IGLPWTLNIIGGFEDPDLIQPDSPPAPGSPRHELERNPRAALDSTIKLLDQKRDTEAARAILLDFLRRYPWNDTGYLFLSLTHWIDRDYRAAMASLVRAIVLRPEQPVSWKGLYDVLVSLGRHRAANIVQAINRPLTNLAHERETHNSERNNP